MSTAASPPDHDASIAPWRIFLAFLVLGVSAFGGPIAHIGYFRNEFVERRRWIDATQFQDLIALCQFLPGPMSTQIGIAIGMLRAGLIGGFAAWLAFTAPSALLMIGLGVGTTSFASGLPAPLVHGLKLAAVAIIAWALWQMARGSCRDAVRIAFATVACAVMLLTDLVWAQVAVIIAAGIAGRFLIVPQAAPVSGDRDAPFSHTLAKVSAGILAAALLGLPVAAATFDNGSLALVSSFFRVGSLVFGGGHVVLPLLQAEVVPPGWVDRDLFLAGYGAAQAVPGPMFTFAGYLGAVAAPGGGSPGGWLGGALALLAIFAPSFLILTAALPYWQMLRTRPALRAALAGVNAAVVGLLLAAFIDPVVASSIASPVDLAVTAIAIALLAWRRVPVWLIVVACASAGLLLGG